MLGNKFKTPPHFNSTERAISARIVIGVTGHRKLENEAVLRKAIRSAIRSIYKMLPDIPSTSISISVLCALAEGVDRLVATEVLMIPNSALEVILPLEKADYMQDFKTNQSKRNLRSCSPRLVLLGFY